MVIFLLLFLTYYSRKAISFPFSLFQIQSGSMTPEIEIGEIIVVVKKQKYEENDIITYQIKNSYFVTHRIWKITEEGYITKGDSNNIADKIIVKKEQIQGKVIFHSKQLGKLYQYRYGLIAISIVLFLPKGRRNYVNKNKKNKSKEKGKNN